MPTFKALLEKGADPLQKRVVEKKEEKEEKKEEKDTKKGKEKEKKEEDPEEMEIVNKIEGTSIRFSLIIFLFSSSFISHTTTELC